MNQNKIFYFIGIKGTGMGSLALLMHNVGYKVLGSDTNDYIFVQDHLEAAKIKILPFNSDNLTDSMVDNTVIVAGNAFNDDNVEISKAKKLNFNVKSYHEMLGYFMNFYKTSIGIAGSHGKTSTTGLLAHIFSKIVRTDYLIGDGTGIGNKHPDYFVFEADEYRRHFMAYHPDYLIITNIDFDHPDYYKNLKDSIQAFEDVSKQAKKGIIAWGEDHNIRKINTDIPIYYYGLEPDNDFQAVNIKKKTSGLSFEVLHKGDPIGEFSVPLFGDHNILNALAVISASYLNKLDLNLVRQNLLTYQGVQRRFAEEKVGNNILIDDYAHHPQEIKSTLDAVRQKYPNKELIAIFQPHTFSRMISFMDEFANSLKLADKVILTDIFESAREKDNGQISSKDLANKIGNDVDIISETYLDPLMQYKDAVLLFMGAGDIHKYEKIYKKIH